MIDAFIEEVAAAPADMRRLLLSYWERLKQEDVSETSLSPMNRGRAAANSTA